MYVARRYPSARKGRPVRSLAFQGTMKLHEYLSKYLDLGWVLRPIASAGGRAPSGVKWQTAPGVTNPTKYRHGIFLVAGERSGVSVIDLDGHQHDTRFAQLIEQHPTPYARTVSGGTHILVSYSNAEWWGNQVRFAPDVDLRNDRGGIVLPAGTDSRMWRPGFEPWAIELADPGPYEELLQELATRQPTAEGKLAPRSTLAGLLARPPREGERNDWLIQVAGHLVPLIPWEDGWLALMNVINQAMPDPLDQEEIEETIAKLYARDKAKTGTVDANDPNAIVTEVDGGNLYLWRGLGSKRERHLWLEPALDIVSVSRDVTGGSLSWVVRNSANHQLETTIKVADVHNGQRLSIVLGNISVMVYTGATGNSQPHGVALQKWLEQQDVNEVTVAPYWGWNTDLERWVGLDDVAVGPEAHKPRIGMTDRPDIIEQMPEWQTPQEAAVFCSWIALQAAKGFVPMPIEPNLVLQGPAGAGKTRGLFAFGARLTGSNRAAVSTLPSLRDRLAGHRNGIVVLDDQSDVDSSAKLLELYRVATSSETVTLKRQTTSSGWEDHPVRLVGSMMVSGEALTALGTDRALRDRSVILEVQPANQRQSVRNPGRSQWDDMQALFRSLGGTDETTAYKLVGPFVRRMLEAADALGPPTLGSGERVTVKLDLLRYGARIWQQAYPNSRGDNGLSVIENVDAWCEEQPQTSDWRSLTLVNRILPEMADSSVGALNAIRVNEDSQIELHPQRLARAWKDRHREARELEVGSADNIKRELAVLREAGLAEYGRVVRLGGVRVKVWTLGTVASLHVIRVGGLEGLLEGTDE